MSRFCLLVALVLMLVPLSSAKAGVSPEFFVGHYKLAHAALGLCDPILQVLPPETEGGRTDIYVGRFHFPNINGGRDTWDSDLVLSHSESVTTADGRLIFHGDTYTKASGTQDHESTVISLRDRTLCMWSDSILTEHGARLTRERTKCIYVRVNYDPGPHP